MARARVQEAQPTWRKADLIRHLGEMLPDGTVLIGIETRRPVDILDGRSAESFRAWLDAPAWR
jgi:hypothetical protein